MNYIWQELCRQRNALARLMLGSLPREESAVQPAVRSESFAEQGTMLEEMDADYPETGVELERGIPAVEAAWMAGAPAGEWDGAGIPLRPTPRRSAATRQIAGSAETFADWRAEPGMTRTSVRPSMQTDYRTTVTWDDGQSDSLRGIQPRSRLALLEGNFPEVGSFLQGREKTESRTRQRTDPQEGAQVRMVTELSRTTPRSSHATPAAMSRAFERDARRYDGGFELYP